MIVLPKKLTFSVDNLIVLLIGFSLIVAVSFPVKAQNRKLNLTLYQNSPAVVHESRSFKLHKGVNELFENQIPAAIIPSSITVSMPSKILEQGYTGQESGTGPFPGKDFLGRHIRLIDPQGNLYGGYLVSLQPNRVIFKRDGGGYLVMGDLKGYKVTADSLSEDALPRIIWKAETRRQGNEDASLTYLTGSLTWSAEYMAVLNEPESKINLAVYAEIRNGSGMNYDNTSVDLIAGTLHNGNNPVPLRYHATAATAVDQVQPKTLSDYHMYSLPRNLNLSNGSDIRVALYQMNNVPAKITYKLMDTETDGEVPITTHIGLMNNKKNGLGEPLPAGKVRVYVYEGDNRILVGQDVLPATAEDEPVSMQLGEAFDLTSEQTTVSVRKVSDKVEEKKVRISITNHKKRGVTVDVPRNVGPGGVIIDATQPYKKIAAGRYDFTIMVSAGQKKDFTYTVRLVTAD